VSRAALPRSTMLQVLLQRLANAMTAERNGALSRAFLAL
jgi:hypothetical protein